MYETLMAMHIVDEASYGRYRQAMLPILRRYGGDFRYDLRVAEVLKGEADHPINRVFAIHFPNRQRREAFFQDPEYRAVKSTHFEDAVRGTTEVASYERT